MTMRRLIPLLAVILLASCDTGPSPTRLDLPEGGRLFTYTAYDAAGAPLLVGTIELKPAVLPAAGPPPQGLAGTWSIDWAEGADRKIQVGPQIGSGQMDGVDDSTGVHLIFLSDVIDDQVSLEGHVYGSGFSGTWTNSTYAGPAQHGRFTAVATGGVMPAQTLPAR